MPFVVLLHIPKGQIKKHIGEKHAKPKGLCRHAAPPRPHPSLPAPTPPHPSSPNQPACGMPVTELHLVSVALGLERHKELIVLLGKSAGFFFQWKPISGGCNTQEVRLVLLGHNDRGCTLRLQSSALTGQEGSENMKMYVLQGISNIPDMFCKPGPTWRKDGHHKTISTKLLL